MISETELVELIQEMKAKPQALSQKGVPVDKLIEYLSFALAMVRFWKNVFGKGGKYRHVKITQFRRIWQIIKDLWELGSKTFKII